MAGVYRAASGTFGMTGTLVLDGENNADAVFIFQMGSTLTVGGALPGNVSMIRGAQACNVFWQVGSAATLNTGSNFVGTIMAHDDISLTDAVTVNGRLLAGEQAGVPYGAVTLIHDTIIKPSTCDVQSELDARAAAARADDARAAVAAEAARAAEAAAAEAAAAAAATAKAEADKAAAAAAAQAAAVAAEAAAKAKAAAAAKIAAQKKAAAKSTSKQRVHALPPRHRFAFTG